MKTKAMAVVFLGLTCFGCCGVPQNIKDAIAGNEKTIKEDTDLINFMTAQESDIWAKVFEKHHGACEKCKDEKEMRLHLKLRAQANCVRAMKLKEWAKK